MKIGEAISRVQSLYSRGVKSDDSRLYSAHIYSKLISIRSLLLNQKYSKKQRISYSSYQLLACIEMVKVKPGDCPCIPSLGCKVLRTPFPLPLPINSLDGEIIQSVSSIEGSIEFSKSSWEEQKYKKGRKYTSNKPEYFIRDNYLYISVKGSSPEVISITGLFRDPLEVLDYPGLCSDCEDCNCDSFFEQEFPIDSDLEDALIQMSSEELVNMFLNIPADNNNNSSDDLASNSKPS